MSIWSDEEIRILREAYPHEGVQGVNRELVAAGFEQRPPKGIQSIAKRKGIKVLPELCGAIRHRGIERRPKMIYLSPVRPLTPDSVELTHWFAERGFSAPEIAQEINRPVEAIHKALGMEPPAIDREPWWPRRDDMILGRAIA